ncbi:MAG: type IV pilin-like G/H family protein [Jaaginema sp. PMC 1079.18]|nr:type IV pilin-like G/H family protein [Jaaginema sp. PMC 1080.18]MEC4850535.1 type IV pilin-like G/H family protein [Jaaginema sp. PMC 1079.18]MEC4865791.1 type IV pilin-like G/H family protein [Jaaginema sp. PMC 1078.18]
MLKITAATCALFLAMGVSNIGVLSLKAETLSPDATIAQELMSHDIAEQLQGRWQFEQDGDTVFVIFTPNNETIFLLPTREEEEAEGFYAIAMRYIIDPSQSPMHLDFMLGASVATTIFGISDDGQQLRINLDSSTETTRPTEFQETDVIMARVSDETEIPEDISVIDSNPLVSEVLPVPIQFITILLQGQQAYYQANNTFADDVSELGFATVLETENYFYEMTRDRGGTSVTIAAIPKTSELMSYVGAVFAVEANGQQQTIAGICQSEQPVEQPPIPQISAENSGEIQCPSGASLIQ